MAALARHIPGCVPSGIAAGLHLVARLPEGTDERAVLERARARDLALYGLSEHALTRQPPALLLGNGRIAEPAIEAGVRELAAAVAFSAPPSSVWAP